MTPGTFIAKWRASELNERSVAQEHFIDLCRLLGEPTPAEADPTGERYCFERGARKDGGGDGWADVWKRHCFDLEYKGKQADLDAAVQSVAAIRAGAGEPTAADRLGHGAVPHPHQLDEQRFHSIGYRSPQCRWRQPSTVHRIGVGPPCQLNDEKAERSPAKWSSKGTKSRTSATPQTPGYAGGSEGGCEAYAGAKHHGAGSGSGSDQRSREGC